MRFVCIACFSMLAVLARLANAQESRVGVEAAFGVGIVSAQSPYRTDLAATGRLGVVVRSRNGRSAEVSGLLLGAFGAGDSFGEPPIPRPVPNTVALSVGCLCRIGASPWTSSIGLGAYHVASRASAPGGTSIGLHGGLQRVVARTAFGSVLVDARVLLLPSIGGSRMWMVPVSAILRSR